jgi:DNA polymerase III delta subunit
MPVLVLAGDEDFELGRRVQVLRDKYLDPAWASVNFLRLDNPALNDISDAAAQLPFGPGNKVVLIDRCDLFTKKRGKAGSLEDGAEAKPAKKEKGKDKTDQLDVLEQALLTVSPNTYLIFSCPYNFDSTLKTSKVVASNKEVQFERFEKERYFVGSNNPKLETWCRKEAKRYGATIEDDAISYLLDGLEADLRPISSELAKAATYILPKSHITLAVVEELTPFHSHVFVLAEKWISGRKAEAQGSLRELLSRQSGMPIIAMLQTMLSNWLRVKVLSEKFNSELPAGAGVKRREMPVPELAKKISAVTRARDFLVEKDLKRIARETSTSLTAKKIELTRLEHLVKTGQIPEAHALELLVLM